MKDCEDRLGVLNGQRIPRLLDRVGDLNHGETTYPDLHACVSFGMEHFERSSGQALRPGHVPDEYLGIGEKVERQ